ncbi:MAG: GNAT family N-acetyltransferase [Candidatus Bathyarchaeia archaeon]|jgi:ribosomal protein S18 acetylase RimI-like enzyme
MDIRIEDASLKYLGEMVEIENQCFTSEAFSRQQISYLLTDYNSISLIAKVNSELAGFVILQLENEDDFVFGHVITLNVAVNFRRMGVAQKLLFECESILRSRGVTECRLEVRQDNHAAIKLYRHLGYVEIGLLEGYYGKKHGLYLKKNL